MSRLDNPIPTLTGKGKALYEKMCASRGRIDGMYGVMLNHPSLTEKVSELGGYLRFNATLPGPFREFIILYCAKKFDAQYEWIKHTPVAEEVGLENHLIDAIQKGETSFPEPYSLLVRAVEHAINLEDIPEELQNKLISLVGVQGVLEVVVLAGFYRMIAGVIFCFDVPLPAMDS